MTSGSVLWVTGAGGFIGREVVRQACRRGYRVVGIGHGDGSGEDGQSLFISGSLTTQTLDRAATKTEAPRAVVHLAGGSSVAASIENPEADLAKTVSSTRALCTWLAANAPTARVVAASSAAVYGSASPVRLCEDMACHPQSPYGVHKLEMEEILQQTALSGRPVAIVRLFSVIGAGLRKQLFFDLSRRAAKGENPLLLSGTGDETRDYISRSDSARLLLDAIDWARSPAMVVNGGTGNATSIREAAEQFSIAWTAQTGKALPIAFNGVMRPGDPSALVAETSRLNALGFKAATSLPSELEHYLQWFNEQGDS